MENPGIQGQHPALQRNFKREAIPALTGYDYQVWVAINMWFDVSDDTILFLEGAEDIDNVRQDDAETIQIRHTQSTISLNTEYAREAIRQFWGLREKEKNGRDIRYIYLTTSEPAHEQNSVFGDDTGIAAWHKAQHDTKYAAQVSQYLIKNLTSLESLTNFFKNSSPETIKDQFFKKFTWLTSQSSIDVIADVVLDKLASILRLTSEYEYPRPALEQIRGQLHAFCWAQIRQPDLPLRVLTKSLLFEQIRKASTVNFTLPIHASASLIGAATQLNLQRSALSIGLVAEEVPLLPEPVLRREKIVEQVTSNLGVKQSVLLTGTVHQGKSTIAALAAEKICAEAWWVDLTERSATQVKEMFNLFSVWIGEKNSPSLIIFDDLNTSISHLRIYSRSLQKFLLLAASSEKSVLLTARGGSEAVEGEILNWKTKNINIENFSEEEIFEEVIHLGCPEQVAAQWTKIIELQTLGQAKLVQVRLKEISQKEWPLPSAADFNRSSQAVQNERQLARALLLESLNGNTFETEFVYSAAVFTHSPSRGTLLNLGDLMPNLSVPGDVISKLEGKWLEQVSKNRFRVTPLIRAEVGETWGREKHRQAHERAYDAIISSSPLNGIEGASLIYHSYISRDPRRLRPAIYQIIKASNEIKQNIFRNLVWLSYVSSSDESSIFPEDPGTALFLRQLQFQVVAQEDEDLIATVLDSWWREIENSPSELGNNMLPVLNSAVMTTDAHVPFNLVIKSARAFVGVKGEFEERFTSEFEKFRRENFTGLLNDGSWFQTFIAFRVQSVSDIKGLIEVIDWIQSETEHQLISEFDDLIRWPLVQNSGAFVHGAWSSYSKSENSWEPLKDVIHRGLALAKAKSTKNFGVELAKALSIIACEYDRDLSDSLKILDEATLDFGLNSQLEAQRANCYFQDEQYDNVLIVWKHILNLFPKSPVTDAFAYRRAAIAASKLERWEEAALYFTMGADCIAPELAMTIRSGMLAEAALAKTQTGDIKGASALMLRCSNELPPEASQNNDVRWEAMLRTLTATAVQIRGDTPLTPNAEPFKLTLGLLSNPELKVKTTDNLQGFRIAMLALEANTSRMYADNLDSAALAAVRAAMSNASEVSWMAALNLIAYELKHEISSEYPSYVKRLKEISLEIQKRTPFASNVLDYTQLDLSYFLLPAVLKKKDFTELLKIFKNNGSFEIERLECFSSALSLTRKDNFGILVNEKSPLPERCASAFALIEAGKYGPRELTVSQGYIMMNLQRALVPLRTSNVSQLVAKVFAQQWAILIPNQHKFENSAWTGPAMVETIRDVFRDKATLKDILRCAAAASGVKLDHVISTAF